MKSFFEKEEFTIQDLESLIENQIEESIHLDFKSGEALSRVPTKKKELSKDIASFANSDGGIIIYGLKEENHVANSFSFVDGEEYTKEWLEQVINTTINRRIEGLLIFPVRNDNNIKKTVYVVKIPRSLDAPHMSHDKRFYKRFNFESVMMEEYEVRQSYGRKVQSKLIIDQWSVGRVKESNNNTYKFSCSIMVYNYGDVSEKDYKVNAIFENYDYEAKLTWATNNLNMEYTVLDENRIKLSAESRSSIFPNETITAMRFEIEVLKSKLRTLLSPLEIKLYLFYPHGEDLMEVNLADIINKVEE